MSKERFQALVNSKMNGSFASFLEDIVFTEQGDFDYATQTSSLTNTNAKGIRTDYTKNEIDGRKVQVGDYRVVIQQELVSIDLRTDNVAMTFKGVAVSIVTVDEDAAEATFILQVREK